MSWRNTIIKFWDVIGPNSVENHKSWLEYYSKGGKETLIGSAIWCHKNWLPPDDPCNTVWITALQGPFLLLWYFICSIKKKMIIAIYDLALNTVCSKYNKDKSRRCPVYTIRRTGLLYIFRSAKKMLQFFKIVVFSAMHVNCHPSMGWPLPKLGMREGAWRIYCWK